MTGQAIVIDAATGELVEGPAENLSAATGQELVELPLSARMGRTRWRAGPPGVRGWVDRPQMTTLAYVDLFTAAEQDAIFLAVLNPAATELRRTVFRMFCAQDIDTGDQRTVAGLDALVTAGLLTAPRRARILDGLPPA